MALIGPTNAGKSTLFNRLTGSWQAITTREESTTRDRIYGDVNWQGRQFSLIDTGGLASGDSALYQKIKIHSLKAASEADLILFVFDARVGLSPDDKQFLGRLKQRPIWLVANKVDTEKIDAQTVYDYLGLPFFKIAASTGRGVGDLLNKIIDELKPPPRKLDTDQKSVVAIIGRPNVGKSTLLNSLLRKERALTSPIPGTTRDVVSDNLVIGNQQFILVDTAGIRRKGKISRGIEKFSVKRALEIINNASAVLILIDATEGSTRGDLHLIYRAANLGKPILIIFNKVDLVEDETKIAFHHHLTRFDYLKVSALTGEGIEKIKAWLLSKLSSNT